MNKRKLDISNYEEWMLDQMEGQLSAEEELLLQNFIAAHPELEEDLGSYAEISLTPVNIEHPDKESLKMPEEQDHALITALESGSDGLEFSKQELVEFQRYQKTILVADERIIFPDKESLKKQEPTPIVPMWLTRVAIAASLIGLVLTLFFQTRTESYEPRLSKADLPSFDIELPDGPKSTYADDAIQTEDLIEDFDNSINEIALEESSPTQDLYPDLPPINPSLDDPAEGLAQESLLDPGRIINEAESAELEIAETPVIVNDSLVLQDEPLIAEKPALDLQEDEPLVAIVQEEEVYKSEAASNSKTKKIGSVLDLLKHATRDSELLALQDAKEESAYVETSLKVGRFGLSVKRKKKN